jgi:hypothetical protein
MPGSQKIGDVTMVPDPPADVPAYIWERDVADSSVKGRFGAEAFGFIRPGGGRHRELALLEKPGEHISDVGVIFDEQTGGVTPKVPQTLARHLVVTSTMDRSTHIYTAVSRQRWMFCPTCRRRRNRPRRRPARTARPRKPLIPRLARFLAHLGGGSGNGRSRGGLKAAHKADPKCAENPKESLVLTDPATLDIVGKQHWRSGRAAECAGLENR